MDDKKTQWTEVNIGFLKFRFTIEPVSLSQDIPAVRDWLQVMSNKIKEKLEADYGPE